MAQLDASIFLQQQAPDLSQIGAGFERGLRIGDLMRQKKADDVAKEKQSSIDQAYKAGNVQNPDGSVSFDKSITIKQLMGIDPREAQKAEAQFAQQDIQKQQSNATMLFQESMKAMQNPEYYQTAVSNLTKSGIIKPGEAPPVFDAGFVKHAAAMAGNAKDYLDNLIKEQDMKEKRADRSFDRQIQVGQFQEKMNERKDAQLAKYQEKQEKKNAAVTEIQDRYLNMKSEIKNLSDLIDKGGTYDVVGPQNEIIDQKITSIATDMAKLVDPTSVARESEVAAFKKMLFSPTPLIRDSTAKDVLKSFEKMVDDRLSTAYKVRGLDQNQAVIEKTQDAQKPQPSQQDIQAFEWAQQNQNDPRAAKIIENLKAKGF